MGPLVSVRWSSELHHWLAPQWAHPQAASCRWARLSESLSQRSVEGWPSAGEWGQRRPAWSSPWGLPAQWASGQRGAEGTGWGLCPSGLQGPHQGPAQALRRLCDLLALAVGPGRGAVCRTPAPSLFGLRSLRAGWVGRLAPSVMTAGQGRGT